MPCRTISSACRAATLLLAFASLAQAQQSPYDTFPEAEPPYYRVRYEASTQQGELPFAVNYTIWIPPGAKRLRGVVVHQHGCGEGSCRSGLTGAFDLHWQALARKHDCALLSPAYEQPEGTNCQLWCDPRNGSDAAFRRCLDDLGAKSGHEELAEVPWALWGHSGGGHWAGGMVMLHPERVAAAWLRSGVPLLAAAPEGSNIAPHTLPEAALKVPLLCNLGTKEGVTVTDGRFAGVWPANRTFFETVRQRGGLIGVAIDPLTSHECGNQRYFAIAWLDACLTARLPPASGDPLRDMPADDAWLASVPGEQAVPAADYAGERLQAAWLPNEAVARGWMQYVADTALPDNTPPPAPTNVRLNGTRLTWEAEADLESGLARFLIERDGELLAQVPKKDANPFGRPVFQGLQYSDTPRQPLASMTFVDDEAEPAGKHTYRVIAVNTAGLKSKPSAAATMSEPPVAASPAVAVKQLVAHRGSSADRPENTLAGVVRAIEAGATAVEVDVRTTADGHLVLLHDPTLDRTTNGSGAVAEMTLAEVQALDAGGWFDPKYRGEKVPTLRQVLNRCRGKIDVLLDLKQQGRGYAEAVAAEIKGHGSPKQTIVGVRSVEQAELFRRLLPEARQLGLIPNPEAIEPFAAAGVETIRLWPQWLAANPDLPERVRMAGARLHLNGTTGHPEEVLALLRYRPDSLSADDPARLRATLEKLAAGDSR